ncbi:MAG TPA: MFS transporter, partial [Vicinamibacteria bacterium]|nr:MFS transporter [Vicinamibacteria bacterium]
MKEAPTSEPRALPDFLAAYAHRGFRLLWAGAFLSSVGTWIQDVALSWLIHSRMGDPFYLGLRSFAQEVPLLAFMLLGGAVADRIDRRIILLSSQWFQMAMALLLGALYLTGHLGIVAIVLIAFATGLMQSQSAPTYQAVITSLVPRERIANAVALNSLQFNLSRAIGPVVAGLLLAHAGAGWCFAANALSFVGVILALQTIEFPPPVPGPRESLRESLLAGLRHVNGTPRLRAATLFAAAASFLAFPLITYLPVIAGDVLKTGASGYSLLLTSVGIGAIVGAVGTAHRGHAAGRGRLMLLAFAFFGFVTVGAALSRWQWLSMVLLVGSGFALTTAFSTLNSLVQEMAPDALRGRV